jgi:hypothetical protein
VAASAQAPESSQDLKSAPVDTANRTDAPSVAPAPPPRPEAEDSGFAARNVPVPPGVPGPPVPTPIVWGLLGLTALLGGAAVVVRARRL